MCLTPYSGFMPLPVGGERFEHDEFHRSVLLIGFVVSGGFFTSARNFRSWACNGSGRYRVSRRFWRIGSRLPPRWVVSSHPRWRLCLRGLGRIFLGVPPTITSLDYVHVVGGGRPRCSPGGLDGAAGGHLLGVIADDGRRSVTVVLLEGEGIRGQTGGGAGRSGHGDPP